MKNCFIEKGEEAREEESLEFVMNGFSEEIINSALSKKAVLMHGHMLEASRW